MSIEIFIMISKKKKTRRIPRNNIKRVCNYNEHIEDLPS